MLVVVLVILHITVPGYERLAPYFLVTMPGDDLWPTDPVAAAFARLAPTTHAVPRARHQLGSRLIRSLGAIYNGVLVLGMLLAAATSTYALLNL